MYLSTLDEWLSYITSIHHQEMELGLDRIKVVAARMNVLTFDCPVVIVGGTNGKGSTVAGIEAIMRASGRHVGAFTSPILFKHNEEVRIDGENLSDETFCEAFRQVEIARGEITITPFEFHTLAALFIFKSCPLDILILEVGLGGRLDAVNIIDPDVAVVTSIGIDHVEYLGPTREHIGFEKAGIFRKDRPAVCGDPNPPESLVLQAKKIGADFYCQGKDFTYEQHQDEWQWQQNLMMTYLHLPYPPLALQNMSTVLMTITLLQNKLPVTQDAIDSGLKKVTLTGRQQIILGSVTEIYDVSHNIDSVQWLKEKIKKMPCQGKTLGVFSMLADKDIASCLHCMKDEINDWYVAPLSVKRGVTMEKWHTLFQEAGISSVHYLSSIHEAYLDAKHHAVSGDRLIIFGSFHTVSEAMKHSFS